MTPGEIAAICYADIFDYPLSRSEIKKFQINCHSGPLRRIEASRRAGIRKPEDDIKTKDNYFFLQGRAQIVQLRQKREKWSSEKLKVAQKIANYLRYIPTIQMIAVTGALAMNNCDQDDDIDILVITKPKAIWTTRFFAILTLELLGKRRRPNDISASNKICLNMFIDEDHLGVPIKERDIFSAHEVAQVKVIWGNNEIDRKFWMENEWIKNYLPNVVVQLAGHATKSNQIVSKKVHQGGPLQITEHFFKYIQLWYMKNKRTTEIIKNGYLRFHPKDARKWILKAYKERLRKVGLIDILLIVVAHLGAH